MDGVTIRRRKKKTEKKEEKRKPKEKKSKKMRYEHYKRVVQWDLRNRFPERKNGNHVPKIEKVTRMWSLIGVGFQPNQIPAAGVGLQLMTGQKPSRVYTKKSVAQRRLKEGDPIGCRVQVTGKAAYERREEWRRRIFPELRPFRGFTVRRKEEGSGRRADGVRDEHGQVTFHLEQPGVIPARTPYYEGFFQLVTGSSGNHVGGRFRSIHTTAKTQEQGLALREGRRFPLTGKGGNR
jgi:large subunit ribosomal protein L5